MDDTDNSNTLDINEVMKHLPHRYPFLLIDKVLDFEEGKTLRAVKNVTINEPFFQGHFPHIPVMPGVLIMEALAQATGILSFKTTGKLPTDDSLYYFVGIDKARFRKPVVPGDQLILEVELERRKRDIWKFKGRALVDGKLVASADLMCAEKELS
ncbi:MAG: 3-hydroxyacyl-ACP dehydratase FabZ [Thiotrichales bacterium]|jgi:3-hydroxyacyl-[acyl-carrier-protein] dehydratase|nr:3-hydroxyacyl-ACP dehydratase FabZ [Thiotrichales bacterium]MBT3752831.1 3-hydroxyacyl-ACP dehydratase FabZ [Thiotrichales bacterium]MBT4152283.1 3-hydroxyacyl-ACP dehydratase FabZ [Thiotrichales bacterium]MBT4261428.1 3-hydroxyacyl-ACP dehydratase FabZ [Thiotrichales bacterium]MBT4573347.1 3-hydroxyacyl-ACP dehydratase FabZ [Thiotrichales bacterium]